MRSRLGGFAGLAALAAVLLPLGAEAAPAAARAGAHRTCAASRSRTLAHNAVVRVFEVRGPTAGGIRGWRVFGCLVRTGRRHLIGERYDDHYVLSGDVSSLRLAGRFVAWLGSSTDISCKADCPPDYQPTHQWVGLLDVASGQKHEIGTPGLLGGVLFLSPAGAAAWLEGDEPSATLRMVDSTGPRVLDQGAIPPSSVTLVGAQLGWARDGEARSTTLT